MNTLLEHNVAAEVTFAEKESYGAWGQPEYRDCPIFAPGGMSWRPKAGQKLLLTSCSGAVVCAGAQTRDEGLLPGEIRLSCGSGYIHLKENGEIVINGMVISPKGEVVQP